MAPAQPPLGGQKHVEIEAGHVVAQRIEFMVLHLIKDLQIFSAPWTGFALHRLRFAVDVMIADALR